MPEELEDFSQKVMDTPGGRYNPYRALGREPFRPELSDEYIVDMLTSEFYSLPWFSVEGYDPADLDIRPLVPDVLHLTRAFQKEFAEWNLDSRHIPVVLGYLHSNDPSVFRYDDIGITLLYKELLERGQIPNKIPQSLFFSDYQRAEDAMRNIAWGIRRFLDPERFEDSSDAYQLYLFDSEEAEIENITAIKRLKAEIARILPEDNISYDFQTCLIRVIALNALRSRVQLKFDSKITYQGTPTRFQLQ